MESKLTISEHDTKEWKLPSGDLHREDGPAVERSNGYKAWFLNGKRHREDGPAIEYSNGDKSWYINGISYNEQEYKYEIRSRKLKQLL
jgi:hypothetical protein